MDKLTLNAAIRKDAGKNIATLRNSGKIPGVLYGFDVKNTPIEIDYKEFDRIYREAGENTTIKINLENTNLKNDNILIYNIDKHPVNGKIIHVDLYAVRMDKKITVNVPLIFEGVSDAVKNLGGTMVKHLNELEVEALPADVPHEIKVDVSKLVTFDDNIKVGDIILPKGAESLQDSDVVVVAVEEPKAVEEVASEEEAGVEDVKVVGEEEKKKGEEGETKEEAKVKEGEKKE